MQVLFSLFFFLKVNSLGDRCQAEHHRHRISFFCKQIYVQVLRVKFSVSSLNCPFLFLSAGMVAAISELRVILWLSTAGSGWWPLRCMRKQRGERGEEEEGWQWENVLWKDRGSSLGVGGSFEELETELLPDGFCCCCCSNAFSFLIL